MTSLLYKVGSVGLIYQKKHKIKTWLSAKSESFNDLSLHSENHILY